MDEGSLNVVVLSYSLMVVQVSNEECSGLLRRKSMLPGGIIRFAQEFWID